MSSKIILLVSDDDDDYDYDDADGDDRQRCGGLTASRGRELPAINLRRAEHRNYHRNRHHDHDHDDEDVDHDRDLHNMQ